MTDIISTATAVVIALVSMLAVILAKIASQHLLRKMREDVKIAMQERQRVATLLKTISAQKEIFERQKSELQNKRVKLERQINNLKEEIKSLEEKEAQEGERERRSREFL